MRAQQKLGSGWRFDCRTSAIAGQEDFGAQQDERNPRKIREQQMDQLQRNRRKQRQVDHADGDLQANKSSEQVRVAGCAGAETASDHGIAQSSESQCDRGGERGMPNPQADEGVSAGGYILRESGRQRVHAEESVTKRSDRTADAHHEHACSRDAERKPEAA